MTEPTKKAAPEVPEITRKQNPNEPTLPMIKDAKERAAKVQEAVDFVSETVEQVSELSERIASARKFIALNTVPTKQASLADCVKKFHAALRPAATTKK